VKKSIFPFEFWDSKICRNDHGSLKSDVTFRVDTFSYKKLFNPTSYAKVMAVLSRHKVFFKIYQNSFLLFFLLTRSHNITKSDFLIFF
jgi:hypothetical protein